VHFLKKKKTAKELISVSVDSSGYKVSSFVLTEYFRVVFDCIYENTKMGLKGGVLYNYNYYN